MPHRRRFLLSSIGCVRAALLAALLGCERAGRIVVVLDSSRVAAGVEVVAMRADGALPTAETIAAATADSMARLRSIDDSVVMLADRFRVSRDSINREVDALDSLDRRTRQYAVRYADIRRRTLAAEQTRSARDAARARAEQLRSRLGPSLAAAAADADGGSAPPSVHRTRATTRLVALTLPAGDWMIGVAPAGGFPSRFERVSTRAGSRDTIRP